MATNTMVALQTQTATSGTASITFSSIPQTYTDLMLIATINASNATLLNVQVGTGSIDTSASYSDTNLTGNGSSATSNRDTGNTVFAMGEARSNTTNIWHFMNYANTTTYKTVLARGSDASVATMAGVGLWRKTTAIDTILIKPDYLSFTGNCTFTLYGIAAQPIATAKATGGTITYAADGYTYHAFTSSGTFTPSTNLTCEALIVAGGGGGGGAYAAGGGGAGGLLGVTAQSLTSGTGYTVTVGSYGAGSTGQYANGSAGNNSSFNSNIAIGGGYGAFGGPSSVNGGNGGSGGGAGYTSASGGTPTSGQGYTGGGTAGGGGGAGGAGAAGNGTTHIGGAGGVGSSAYSQWGLATGLGQNVSGTVYFAGGGGGGQDTTGGAGGYGGGGNGSGGTNTGGDAMANTGGGGGGEDSFAGGTGRGGNGGTGVVIIRYLS